MVVISNGLPGTTRQDKAGFYAWNCVICVHALGVNLILFLAQARIRVFLCASGLIHKGGSCDLS